MFFIFFILISYLVFVRNQLAKYIGLNIDWHIVFHITTLILGLLALLKVIIKGKIFVKKKEYFFLFSVMGFLFLGVFYLPDNSLFITYWGIFEYLYIFLFAYFLSFFVSRRTNVRLIYISFKSFIFLIVGIAIYQEIEFLLHRFDIIPVMLFKSHPEEAVRLGILRPPSFVGGPTEWGSITLIYLLADFYLHNFKLSKSGLIILFFVIISVTRSLYLSLLGVVILLVVIRRKYLIAGFKDTVEKYNLYKNLKKMRYILILSSIVVGVILVYIFIYSMQKEIDFFVYEGHLRGYALNIATKIDNPISGLGPGMFGSYVSFVANTPFLEKYWSYILQDVQRIKTIDSYWLQVFIETGIVGILLNIMLFIGFYRMLFISFKNLSRENKIIKSIAFACLPIPLIYAINGIGFTTFIPSYVIWSSILSGTILGYERYFCYEKTDNYFTNRGKT